MFGDLKFGSQWNYEVPHALGGPIPPSSLRFRTPTKKNFSLKQSTKFKCLVISNWVLTSTVGNLVQSYSMFQSSLKAIGPTKRKQKNTMLIEILTYM
jgi:hypothetical protein